MNGSTRGGKNVQFPSCEVKTFKCIIGFDISYIDFEYQNQFRTRIILVVNIIYFVDKLLL